MNKTKDIDILDLLLILAKHKKFIFWTTLIASIAAVTFILLVDQYWTATATILPAKEDKNQLSFGGSSLLGLGSSLLGGGLQSSGMELITIMNSRTFSEDVIKHFNLLEYMELEDADSLVIREKAFKTFNEKIRTIGYSEETGLINITIETQDKYLSADIANYMWQKLEKYNIDTRMSKGKRKRIFLGKRLDEVESLLDSLSKELLNFQVENNIIELGEQTINIVKQYSTMISEQKTKEIQIELLEKSLNSDGNPYFDKLKLENEILKEEISKLEISSNNKDYKYLLSLGSIPHNALELATIKMNLEIQKQVYSFLYPQFEQARIEEIKDLPTIEIVDEAIASGLRSKPKRARFCILVFIITLLLSSSLVYTIDVFQNSNNNVKLRELKNLLFKKNRDR